MEAHEVVSGPADLAKINALLGELLGQPCWRLKFIYGDELMVAFGAQVPESEGPLKGRLYGEWELVTRASPWRLFRPDGSEITNADVEREEAELHFGEVAGGRVKAAGATLPDLDLRIEFDDGKRLDVPCCEDDETDSDDGEGQVDDLDDYELACWELYMPGGRLLSTYPERRWAISRTED